MNPDAPAINVRIALSWENLLREGARTELDKLYLDEDLKGKSSRLCQVMPYYLALHYMTIIHQDIVAPYAIPTTSDELKERFDFDEVKDCFACKGIYLDDLWTEFGIDEIALTNVDDINDV